VTKIDSISDMFKELSVKMQITFSVKLRKRLERVVKLVDQLYLKQVWTFAGFTSYPAGKILLALVYYGFI
jgi:hypothetical protein